MIFNMAGGGSPLNFQVKPYPSETELKSDNPKKNTIGIITTTTMTSWVFSAKEPTEPEGGMVLIYVGNASAVEFNALKKNTLQVYPRSVKQYVGGKWESKTAYSYIGGEWVDWITYLYNSGDECTDLTGGWSAIGWRYNEHHNNVIAPTVEKKSNSMVITISSEIDIGAISGVVEVTKDIDVTNASILRLRCESVETSGRLNDEETSTIELCVVNRNAEYFAADAVARATAFYNVAEKNNNVVLECDLSNVEGTYDIVVGLSCYCTKEDTQTITAVLKSVEME